MNETLAICPACQREINVTPAGSLALHGRLDTGVCPATLTEETQ
jgi:hypothetical protein